MSTDALVIIDPQNDFCDPKGSLYVEGAAADIGRLSRYIIEAGSNISGIFVSLDSHDEYAIFHPAFWVDDAGRHPDPFIEITAADFKSGRWTAAAAINKPFAERTFAILGSRGIESLTVWPEHCIVSTWGHRIADPLVEALKHWRNKTGLAVRYVFKGENPYMDQYSAFEGLDDTSPQAAFNKSFFVRLVEFESVTFAGEALSHCVQESVLSYLRRLGYAEQRVRLLTDCTSPVKGFDARDSLEMLGQSGVIFETTESLSA